jgi:tRNA(Ile)-lysidine synthase
MTNWTTYHVRLHKTLKTRKLLPPYSKILIGVSGGQDSLCLAHLCLDLQAKWHWQVAIAHYDHSWELDQGLPEHIGKICQNWGAKLYIQKATETIPETEAAARKYRYEALINIATQHQFNYLLTGHTLSDRSETFIYNLLRGGGIEGLTSLHWTRQLTENITLVRPMLNFLRQETLEFCQQMQLPIWEDEYNRQKKFARNRIRLDLIPYLEENFNPQTQKHLAQTAEILRADLEYLQAQTQELFQLATSENNQALQRSVLAHQPLSLQRRVVKKYLEIHLPKMPRFERIEEIVNLITAPNGSCSSTLAQDKIAQVKDDFIQIVKATKY